MPEIIITPEFQAALQLLDDSRQHVFVTGKAGTGKSTLLQHFRKTTKKKVVVLAPTGVAALNVQGQTIHSFFRFRPDITPDSAGRIRPNPTQTKLYKELDALVIDEVSMLRADLLDSIDAFLRRHGPERGRSFGGVQMLLFGDLYQLPPVVTRQDRALFTNRYPGPHFFHANVMRDISLYLTELTSVFRQQEERFITILNAIRENQVDESHFQTLNARCRPESPTEGVITLTTTNDLVDRVNQARLASLSGRPFVWQAHSTGTFSERDFPTPANLELKAGAQVMLLTNDPRGRWVNGSIGRVRSVYDDPESTAPTVEVKLTTGRTVPVTPFTWEVYRYEFHEGRESIEPTTVGTYTQYPLRLAWAVTIHKSQGKTFDRVVIDLGRGTFSPGQLYVALSRCRTLDGITLRQPVQPRHMMSDASIVQFLDSFKDGVRAVGQSSWEFEEFQN
ncbi:AAA family ATPase [Patescibacteria group bacterium]|nr:AAA family ATPase [Patescibacteria group bacterium]